MRGVVFLFAGVLAVAPSCDVTSPVESSASTDPGNTDEVTPIDETGDAFLRIFEDEHQANATRFDAARQLAARGYLPAIPALIRNIGLVEFPLGHDPEAAFLIFDEIDFCRCCSCIGMLAKFGRDAIELTVDECLSLPDNPMDWRIWQLTEALNTGKMREHMDYTCAYIVRKAGNSDNQLIRSNAVTLFVLLKVNPTFKIPEDLKWKGRE